MAEKGNPVVEVYKGRPIRKYNKVYIRVTSSEMKQFIDAKQELGLSERDVIEHCNAKLETCRGVEITMWNRRKDKSITLTKGFLCKK